MSYKKPKRMFEDAGLVDPRSAYHVDLERVLNTKNQDVKTIVDRARYFSIFALDKAARRPFSKAFVADWQKTRFMCRFCSASRTLRIFQCSGFTS